MSISIDSPLTWTHYKWSDSQRHPGGDKTWSLLGVMQKTDISHIDGSRMIYLWGKRDT